MKLLKKIFYLFLIISTFINAQIINPVKWKSEIKLLENQEFEAIYTAKIEKPWHLYSKDLSPNSGIPTSFEFQKNKNIKLTGKLQEIGNKKQVFSEVFGADLIYYSDQVIFKQKFKLLNQIETDFIADILYQVCDDKVCLAPENEIISLKIPLENNGKEIKSQTLKDSLKIPIQNTNLNSQKEEKINSNELIIKSLDYKNPIKNCGIQEEFNDETNYLKLILLGFLGGLLALLTPCVFPMIPLTVSYFTKSKDKKAGKNNALIYAFFIILIFSLLSIPFHIFESINSDIFNQISTNIWLNLAFFIIFIVFAFSFFGYFDITLPSWITNKSDKASNSSGILGLFFMALTLVIVSFSCTGPILGSLLAGALTNTNGAWQLTSALLGFGLSWGIIFGALALFPNVLASLPKSGSWMTTFKVILGFLEIALALKFLSKADLVAKTNFINREIFIGIWIFVFILLAIYLFGLIRFPHDDKNQKIGNPRKIFGFIILIFIGYLIWGIFPSKEIRLKSLSGILPPAHLSFYNKHDNNCPLGLNCIHDYHQGIEESKKTGKPILLDFTGFGCENCRKMEEFVWSEPEIYSILNEKVIIVSVYVDDKQELPLEQQQIITLKDGKKRKIKTIGDKWSVFQRENFNSNSQPHYVLINSDQKVINFPLSGYRTKEEFLNFLKCGINN